MSEQDYSGHKERPTEPIVKPIIGNIAPLQARIAELEKEKNELMDSDRNNDKTRVPKDQWELLIKAAKKGMADAKINEEKDRHFKQLQAENDSLKAYERFYRHIRKCVDEKYSDCNHVICSICNDTFEHITQTSEQALQGKKGSEK